MKKSRILWIDDEIDLLKPHILFLEERNYEIVSASNGTDGISLVAKQAFDLVLLDEMMPGLDGLETLEQIKKINTSLPVVMVTKNEEEGLMNKAISCQISDYIIKPINPHQVLMSIKKILLAEEIQRNRIGQEYTKFSAFLNQKLFTEPTWDEWQTIFSTIVDWDLKFDDFGYEDIAQMHSFERANCNIEFSNYVERNYLHWMENSEKHPPLSHDIVKKHVVPQFAHNKPVYFIVLDCLRYDQLMVLKPYLEQMFNLKTDFYLSTLPTTTQYARNALFAGMTPYQISTHFPQYWKNNTDAETSLNRYEHFFIDDQLSRLKVKLPNGSKYTKVLNAEEGQYIIRKIPSYKKEKFVVIVYNFLDMLLHHRFRDEVLQEMLPNDRALRSLTKIWFLNSNFYKALQLIAKQDAIVVLTTDHGSIKVEHPTKLVSDRDVSSGLRVKHGKNLAANDRHALLVSNPNTYGLPADGVVDNFIFAKGDYYFVFPTDYNEYKKRFHGTYQHGGISMDEMILPVTVMTPKK